MEGYTHMYMCVCVCVCVCVLFWSHLQCSYLSRHSKFMHAILQELPKLGAVVSYVGYILMVLVATQLFCDKLMCVVLYPAYAMRTYIYNGSSPGKHSKVCSH